MKYMLDTDICSYVMKFHPAPILQKLQARSEAGDTICISAITYAELRLGAERSNTVDKYNVLIDEFTDRIDHIEPWTEKVVEIYAPLLAQFMRAGNQIGINDTMIAAHALCLGAILVSNNQKHFSRVPGLFLENWAN